MFFGLFNASINFQGNMGKIVTKKLNTYIIIYLIDILIYINKTVYIHSIL